MELNQLISNLVNDEDIESGDKISLLKTWESGLVHHNANCLMSKERFETYMSELKSIHDGIEKLS